MSTGTHGANSLPGARFPLADYIVAIHLVGTGGMQFWLERGPGVTDREELILAYPCLNTKTGLFDDRVFNAALVAFGSIGVIYSVIIEVEPQSGMLQHRLAVLDVDQQALDALPHPMAAAREDTRRTSTERRQVKSRLLLKGECVRQDHPPPRHQASRDATARAGLFPPVSDLPYGPARGHGPARRPGRDRKGQPDDGVVPRL